MVVLDRLYKYLLYYHVEYFLFDWCIISSRNNISYSNNTIIIIQYKSIDR